MILKLPRCFPIILLTTLYTFFLSPFAIGQVENTMLDSLKRQFIGASTVDSAYIAEDIAKKCRAYGDPTNCLDYAQMAYFLAKKVNDSSLLASTNNIIGTVYVIYNNLEDAYQYLTEANKIYAGIGDTIWEIKTLNNLALIHWKKEEFEEAKRRFHEIIDRVEDEKNPDRREKLHLLKMVSYYNLGLMHFESREINTALQFFHHADSLQPEIKVRMDSIRMLQLSVRLAQSYFELGNFDKAAEYVERGNSLGLNKGAEDHMLRLLEVEKSIHLVRGELDLMIEKNREYAHLKNKYFDVEKQKEILNLNKQFEFERREQERVMLEKELAKTNLQHMLLGSLVAFFLVISVLLYSSLRSRRKTNQALREQATALKQAIFRAEKASKAKDEFLSMMSHEIRTPMNGIIGMTNILLEESPRPRQKESLNILKTSANHLLALINDILDYNKLGTQNIKLENKNFNLKETLDMLCKALKPEARKKGLNFIFDFDPDLSEFVIGDSVRISQVINNLVSNAIKFTTSGKISVSISQTALGSYRFEVQDTGIGIAPENQKIIFERFNQLSSELNHTYGGTGLGLTISKKLVEMMGGCLQVESEAGTGSRFFFTLNLTKGRKPVFQKPSLINTHIGELKDYVILLAEDNPVNTLVATKFLTKWGATMVTVPNGKAAVQKAKEMPFDAILMDIQMPVMSGIQATQYIRQLDDEKYADVPIIALTASVLNKEGDWAAKNGFDGFIFKPFRPEELLQNIKRVCPIPGRMRKTIEGDN